MSNNQRNYGYKNYFKTTFRFQKLNFRRLRIDRKYLELVACYKREIEETRDRYNEDRLDPPLPRNVPPVSGRIFWIRQLYKRVECPMKIYKTRPRVITHERMQKCIKIYNALISVFIHYEMIYHKAWYDSADVVSSNSGFISIIVLRNNVLLIKRKFRLFTGQASLIVTATHPPS